MRVTINKIQTKITLTYIFFSIVALTSLGILIDYEIKSSIKEITEKNLLHEIDFIERYLSDISKSDLNKLFTSLKSYAKSSGTRITLIDSTGLVYVDTDIEIDKLKTLENHLDRPEIIAALKTNFGKDTRLSKSTHQEYLYIAKKITLVSESANSLKLRFVRVSISLSNINNMIEEIQLNIIYAGLLVLIMVFVLSVFISKRMTKPIIGIRDALNEITKGNYDRNIVVRSNDELKLLADSINKLVEKIKHDIAELKKLSEVRSEFLANVSHEIRTPLFSIQAYLETLINGGLEDPGVNKNYLQKSLNNVERLNVLLNDLIEISRIESGELKLSFRYIKLEQLLNSVAENLSIPVDHKKMKLEINCNPDIEVLGDKEKLFTVIANLVDNAVKYNSPGTIIKINCLPENGRVKISIQDNGIGIAQEHLSRIFERFYRVDKNRSRENGGSGLGLAIVKHIVEAHGSKVEVESIPNGGTKFFFTLKSW